MSVTDWATAVGLIALGSALAAGVVQEYLYRKNRRVKK